MSLRGMFGRSAGSSSKKPLRPNRRDRRRAVAEGMTVEAMEPRLLMSATPFAYAPATDVAQNLTLDLVDILGVPTVELRQTATSAVVLQRALADVSAIEITLSTRADRITVAADFSSAGIGASILGQGGFDTLTGPAGGSTYTVVGAGGAVAGVGFSGIESIQTGSGADEIALSVGTTGIVRVAGGTGDDTLHLFGNATTGTYIAATDGAGVLRHDTGIVSFVGIESIVDHTTTTNRTVTATPGDDTILVTTDAHGRILVDGPTFTGITIAGPGASLSVTGGGGRDEMSITGTIAAPGADLAFRAETIVVADAVVDTRTSGDAGSFTLVADGTEASRGGSIGDISAEIVSTDTTIALDRTRIATGNVLIVARSTADGTGEATGVAALSLAATATVGLNETAVLAEGDVTISTRTAISGAVVAHADPTVAADEDAAVAWFAGTNRSEIALRDSGLAASGSISVAAQHSGAFDVRASGGGGEIGATTAVADVDGSTAVAILDQTVFVAGGRLDVTARATTAGSTEATATAGGSAAASGQRGARALAERDVEISGTPAIAAATALTDVDQNASVLLSGTSQIAAVGGASLVGSARHLLSTTADASAADGAALGNAAAVGMVDDHSAVTLSGDVTVAEQTPRLVLRAGDTSPSTSIVEAISGTGASDALGEAGALALNLVSVTPTTMLTGAVHADRLDLYASSIATVDADAIARARLATGDETGGMGASFALTRLDDDLTVALFDGARLEGVDALTLVASGTDDSSAAAWAGSEGGSAVSPATAMSISDSDATVVVDSVEPIDLGGALTMNVLRTHLSSTLAEAESTGDGVAAGAALAVDYGAQNDVVALASPITTTTANLITRSTFDGSTRAVGSSRGAGDDVGAAARAAAAVAEAAGRADGGPSSIDAATPLGDLGAAAAIALRLQGGSVESRVASDGALAAVGNAAVVAESDVDGSAVADASLVGTRTDVVDTGAGTALAYALGSTTTIAEVDGFVFADRNVSVRAAMAAGDTGPSAQRSVLSAEAISGASADALAIGGAAAVADADLDAIAHIGDAAVVFADDVTVSAQSQTRADATATADATAGAAGEGIGAGLAFALSHSHGSETADLGNVEVLLAENLTITANGDHVADATAEAGTSGGFIGAAPAFAVISATDHALASTGTGASLTGLTNLVLTATDRLDASGSAKALDASGIASGAAIAYAAIDNTADATLARDVGALGRVSATARETIGLDLDAVASAAGVAADAGSNAQNQLGTAAASARGASGAGTPSLTVPDGTGAPVPVGVAAALAVASIGGGAAATQAAGTDVFATSLALTATGDVDSDVTADASAVDDLDAHAGIGVAVAVDSVDTGFDAVLAGSVTAASVALTAGSTSGQTSTLSATAISGAGAADIGAAGAFAADFSDLDAEARVVSGVTILGPTRLTITASLDSDHHASALSNLDADTPAHIGVGASIALIELDDDTTASLAADVSISSLSALTMSATGSHTATATAEAGGAGDIAVTPTLALNVSTADSRIDMPAGAALSVSGAVTLTATHDVAASATADGSAGGSDAAVGAAIALNLVHDTAEVVPGRALTAGGDVRYAADLVVDAIAGAVAAASGVAATSGGAGTAGGQAGAAAAYGNAMSGGRAGSVLPPMPTAAAPSGATQIGVAAALGYNLVDGGARAVLGADAPVTSTKRVTVASAADIDVDALADASATDSEVGVGTAVAVDEVDAENVALIEGTVAAKGITVTAGLSARDDGVDSLGAYAISGAGATDVGVAGALAYQHATLDTTAEIRTAVDPRRGDVTVSATSVHDAVTSASGLLPTEDDPKVGVGASLAVADFDFDATARIGDGIALAAAGAVTLAATTVTTSSVLAEAGGAGGTAVFPALALTTSDSDAVAEIGAGTALTAQGAVAITAAAEGTYETLADGRSVGDGVGIGAAIAVNLVDDAASAGLGRSLSTSGDVTVSASADVVATAETSGGAKGAADDEDGPSIDGMLADALDALGILDEAEDALAKVSDVLSTASDAVSLISGGRESSGTGIAAAIAYQTVTTRAEAEIADGLSVTTTAGAITVDAEAHVAATASADGTAFDPALATGVAGAVAYQGVTVVETATIGLGATIRGATGVTVTAGASDTPDELHAQALGGAGADHHAVAGSIAVDDATSETRATIADDADVLSSAGAVTVRAVEDLWYSAVAGAGAISSDAGAGAAVALGLIEADTEALVGARVDLDAAGDVTVQATGSVGYDPNIGDGYPVPTAAAVGGALSRGSDAYAGSLVYENVDATFAARIDTDARIDQRDVAPLADQDVIVDADGSVGLLSIAGGGALGFGGGGIGLALAVGDVTAVTTAELADGVLVKAGDDVVVDADGELDHELDAASFGLALDGKGAGGSLVWSLIDDTTSAEVGTGVEIVATGDVSVTAADTLGGDTSRLVAGAGGVSGSESGFGVSIVTLDRHDRVTADIADDVRVALGGNLTLAALSRETISLTAVGGAGAEATAIAGSATLADITEDTTATLGDRTVVEGLAAGDRPGSIAIEAEDATTLTQIAGAIGFGGDNGVGAGLVHTTLVKSTLATIGTESDLDAAGDVSVRADSDETVRAYAVSLAGSLGDVAVAGALVVQEVDLETVAAISDDAAVFADGSVIVEAADDSEYDLMVGGLALTAGKGVGASAVAPHVTKSTSATIGENADVTALGLGYGSGMRTGVFAESYRTSGITNEVKLPGLGAGDLPVGADLPWGDGDEVDTGYAGEADAARVRTLTPRTRTITGVGVSATSSDDFGLIAVNGSASGDVAVDLSGAVGILDVETVAEIGAGARIDQGDQSAAGTGQDVVVMAGEDLRWLSGVGAGAAGASAALAPSAAVAMIDLATTARIAADALVSAADTVAVEARANEDVVAVTAGLALGGDFGLGVSANVVSIDSATSALIGDPVSGRGATVDAGGDVVVQALDDTDVLQISGSLGGSLGGAGGAAGADVLVIDKTTVAAIADGSSIGATGAAPGGISGLGGLDGRFADTGWSRGLAVHAGSTETIQSIAESAAAGNVGIGGAAAITVIGSTTLAEIGDGVTVTADDVSVAAENTVDVFAAAGGLGVGQAGIAGAANIGIVHNSTVADLGDGVVVASTGMVDVQAVAEQTIFSLAHSVGAGGVAVPISSGIWVVGGDFLEGGGDASEAEFADTYQGLLDGSAWGGYETLFDGFAPLAISAAGVSASQDTISVDVDGDGSVDETGLRTGDAVVYHRDHGAIAGLVDGETYYVVAIEGSGAFRLAASRADAEAGIAVGLGAASGSGMTLAYADTAAAGDAVAGDPAWTTTSGGDLADAVAPGGHAFDGAWATVGNGATVTAASGLRITADDDLAFEQIAGDVGGGSAAVGASFVTLVHHDSTVAALGVASTVTIDDGDLIVAATSSEDVSQMAVGAVAGGVAVTGSGVVTLLTEVTSATVGSGSTVVVTGGEGDVVVTARDDTAVFALAGAAGFSGSAGAGAGVDVGVIDKTTTASIGRDVDIDATGSVTLRATATEDVTSLAVTGAVGSAAGAGSASVYDVTTTTHALLGAGSGRATVVEAAGNVVVEATDVTEMDLFGGSIAVAGSGAVGGAAAVPVVTKDTQAIVGSSNRVTARGLGGTASVADGTVGEAWVAPDATEVINPGAAGGSGLYETQTFSENPTSGDDDALAGERDGSFDSTYQGDTHAGLAREAAIHETARRGVVVAAQNITDVSALGISAGLAGGVAATLSGSIEVIDATAIASIEDGASINQVAGSVGGSVAVLAGNDLTLLNVAVAVSGSGSAAVSPSAAIAWVTLDTEASIGGGVHLDAQNLDVAAHAAETFSAVAAGAAVGAGVGIGGSGNVVSLDSTTTASIGDSGVFVLDGSGSIAGTDVTSVTDIAGGLGIGGGGVGVGASGAVVLLSKDTTAAIGDAVTISTDGDLAVDASSSETITVIAAAGGGGLLAGVAGAGAIVVVDSDTVAEIGDATITAARDDASRASVSVVADNDVSAFSFAGSVGGGGVAVSGGLGIGIVRNGVLASIGQATVDAADDVIVSASSTRDVDAFSVSAGGGLASAVGSIGVWTFGGDQSTRYDYTEQDYRDDDTPQAHARSDDALGGTSSGWAAEYDDAADGGSTSGGYGALLAQRSAGDGGSSSRIAAVLAGRQAAVGAGGPATSIAAQQSAAGDLADTAALVDAVEVTAGGDVSVTATDTTTFDMVIGGVSGGAASFGASIGIANFSMATRAEILGGTVSAGETIAVAASATHDATGHVFVGQGGLITLGSQVIALGEHGDVVATVDESVVFLGAPDGTSVTATQSLDQTAGALGVGVSGALAGGVSVAVISDESEVVARMDGRLGLIDGPASGGSLTVAADADLDASVESWGIGLSGVAAVNGAVAMIADTRTVSADLGSSWVVADDVTVAATSDTTATAEAVGASLALSGIAVGAAVASVDLAPTVTATLGNPVGPTSVIADDDVTVSAELDRHGGDGATATAWSVGGSLLFGFGGALALARQTPTVRAEVEDGAIVGAQDLLSVTAVADLDTTATATGVAGGIVGVGVSVAIASADGGVDVAIGEGAYLVGRDVMVSASDVVRTTADTQAASGGLVAGNVNLASARDDVDVTTSLADGAVLQGDDVTVAASDDGRADADTRGVSVGGFAVGSSIAEAEHLDGVAVTLGEGSAIYASDRVTLAASTARADATASATPSGAGIIAAVIGRATATVGGATTLTSNADVVAGNDILISVADESFADSSADGIAVGYVGIGAMSGRATDRRDAALVSLGDLTAGDDVDVSATGAALARTVGNSTSGGILAGAGVNIDTVVDSTVSLTLDGVIAATDDVTVRAEGTAEGDATAHGAAVALIGSGGVVQADLTVDGEVALTLRPGTRISGDDVTVSAVGGSVPSNAGIPGVTAYSIGDGRSNLDATGFAAAAFAGIDNRALADVDQTVTVFVDGTSGQQTRIEAVDALAITAENHAATASFAGGGGGGAIAASFSNTRAIMTATTEVIVGDRNGAAGEDNVVLVAETADVDAEAFLDVRATADTDAGSVLGSHSDADARASLFYTTRAGLGRAARVNAPDTSIVAETSHDVVTVMTADSSGAAVDALAGRNGVDGSPAGSYLIGGSLTEVFADADSEIVALDGLEMRAQIVDADIRSTAEADSDAAGAVSKATATATADEDVRVTVDERADLKGRTALTLAALVEEGAYAISTDSYARFDGVLGSNTAESYTTGEVATLIDARDTAVLRSRSLVVDATNGLDGTHGMSATATRHNFIEGDKPGSEWIVTDQTSANILFDADVELIRPFAANATLEIDRFGHIVTANNITVNGGLGEGDDVGVGSIEIDDLRVNATGDATFRAGARGVIRGSLGAWTVQQGAGDISIVNDSAHDLIVGDIDAVGHRVPTSGEDVFVDVGDARAFTFDVVGTFDIDGAAETADDTLVSIVNDGGDVIIAGLIDNPLGTTHIFADGDILDGYVTYTEDGYVNYEFDGVDDPGLIRTLRLELEATGSIGSQNDLRPYYGALDVELVQSADHIPTADIYAHGETAYLQISQVIRSNALVGLAVVERLWASDRAEVLFWPGRVETALPGDHGGGLVVRAQDSLLNSTATGNDGPISNAAFYREFYYPDGAGTASTDYLGAYGEATGAYRATLFDVNTRTPGDDFTLELFGPSNAEYPVLSAMTVITRHYTLASAEDAGDRAEDTAVVADARSPSAAETIVLDGVAALGLDGLGLAHETRVAAHVDEGVEIGWFDEPLPAEAAAAATPEAPAPFEDWMAIDPIQTLPKRIDWSARRLA